MASVSELELSSHIASALRKRKIISLAHILVLPKDELATKLQISANDVNELYDAIYKRLNLHAPYSALDIWEGSCKTSLKHRKLTFGCKILDDALRGGILLPGINEISGESGSGKTQLALQLCLTAQLPSSSGGLNGGAIFISTEDAFPTKRLHQLASFMQERVDAKDLNLMDNIYVEHAADVDDLWGLTKDRLPRLLMHSSVRFIVIDSIAALFRVEFTMNEALERSKAVTKLGRELMKLSHQHNVAVLCINQISDVVSDNGKGEDIGGRRVVPALGLSWSNLVTMRLMVMRLPFTLTQLRGSQDKKSNDDSVADTSKDNTTCDSVVRKVKVLFAPHLPNNECHYVVEETGVRGIQV